MESAQAPVAIKIHTAVVSIEEIAKIERVTKDGVPTLANLGWFVLFTGSHERLYVGTENPGLAKGDEVEIIIRKKPPCQPTT